MPNNSFATRYFRPELINLSTKKKSISIIENNDFGSFRFRFQPQNFGIRFYDFEFDNNSLVFIST